MGILMSNFSEIVPLVFSVVDRTHAQMHDKCKTVYPQTSWGGGYNKLHVMRCGSTSHMYTSLHEEDNHKTKLGYL
jgi:hypothetical protein